MTIKGYDASVLVDGWTEVDESVLPHLKADHNVEFTNNDTVWNCHNCSTFGRY